jgi:hypothetical protein
MQRGHHEPESLVHMRTHLTIVTLAVAQLRRRHGADADIERLCAFADTALQQLKEDIAEIQAALVQQESREESRQAHLRLRQSLNADRLDTGPLSLPSHAAKDR